MSLFHWTLVASVALAFLSSEEDSVLSACHVLAAISCVASSQGRAPAGVEAHHPAGDATEEPQPDQCQHHHRPTCGIVARMALARLQLATSPWLDLAWPLGSRLRRSPLIPAPLLLRAARALM